MEAKDYCFVVGILLTFILGVWNLIVSRENTRRANFINTVTSQRVKWIEQLRQDISLFVGLIQTWSLSEPPGAARDFETMREIDRLRHVIRLRLNPSGNHDQEIARLIRQIPKLTSPHHHEALMETLEKLVNETQLLIKQEWEKVKHESQHGNLAASDRIAPNRASKRTRRTTK
ncbi:hypothetical protein BH09SUM1_BH09SUM1_09970 [soil metagenome]